MILELKPNCKLHLPLRRVVERGRTCNLPGSAEVTINADIRQPKIHNIEDVKNVRTNGRAD